MMDTPNTPGPLPCPFCGAPAEIGHSIDDAWRVGCTTGAGRGAWCRGSTPMLAVGKKTLADAVEAWNRRAPAPQGAAPDPRPPAIEGFKQAIGGPATYIYPAPQGAAAIRMWKLPDEFRALPVECEPGEFLIGLYRKASIYDPSAFMVEIFQWSGRDELSAKGCFAAIGPVRMDGAVKDSLTVAAQVAPQEREPLPPHLLPFHDEPCWKQRDDLVREVLELKAEVERLKAAIKAELDAQKQHYSECAAAAAAGSRLYQGERDMTEGVIKGLEYALNAVTRAEGGSA